MQDECDNLTDIFIEGVAPYPDLVDGDANTDDTPLDDCNSYNYEVDDDNNNCASVL
jgi:hypothetical protein